MTLMIKPILSLLLATALLTLPAWADGKSDLQMALQRLQGTAPLTAELTTNVRSATGQGSDRQESHAQAAITISDTERGFQVLYGKPLLSRIDQEQEMAEENPDDQTPTLDAISNLKVSDLRHMVSAASELKRQLDDAEFKSESEVDYNGVPARLLTFEQNLSTLSESEREYLKEFESTIEVWIAEDGTPLASRSQMNGKGRFMVVIKFEFSEFVDSVYQTVGDRLTIIRREAEESSSGAGEVEDSNIVQELRIL